jgi:putative GTP pyrophosphokinase
MSEQEIFERWKLDKPNYLAWAKFIGQQIEERLLHSIAPMSLEYFLKVPMVPRLKTDASLIDKALYRDKNYKSPYDDITDKVGIRYVVLLTTHIAKFCEIIQGTDCDKLWSWSKDKDYEAEREARPLEFTYQSVHYVLKSKMGCKMDGLDIPENISCEVQIRTLLQHAHSELTHDTLYKPKTTAKSSVKRTVAKSMALIEATDEFFEQAMSDLNLAGESQKSLLDFLTQTYTEGTGAFAGKERSNQLVIDAFIEFLSPTESSEIKVFLTNKSYVFEKIKEQNGIRHFFNQPTVLLAYYLASKMPAQTKANWPFESTDLAKIFSDLGMKFDD